MDENMILPDDFEATPSGENTEVIEENGQQTLETEDTPAEEVQEQEQTTEQQQPTELPKIKIKFNHEEKELGYDEAVPLIQKGMNYDKITQQLEGLKSDPRLSFVEELAQANNMTVNEYIDAVKKNQYESEVQKLVEQNIPEEYAREMLENKKFRQEMTAKQKAESEAIKQKETEQRQIKEFAEAFPGITADKIPDEVLEKVQAGTPLKFAYMEYQMKQLETENKILKQNKTNTKKAPVGSVAVHGSNSTGLEDPFLSGFESIK